MYSLVFQVGRWGLTTPPKKYLLPRNHYGSQDPHMVVVPVKKKFSYIQNKCGQTHKIMGGRGLKCGNAFSQTSSCKTTIKTGMNMLHRGCICVAPHKWTYILSLLEGRGM
jgi:hypothetical protein